jgi:signal transduction histidine kinase
LDPEDVVRRAAKIQGSAARIQAVVDSILLAASLRDGSWLIQKQSFQLHTMIDGLIQQVEESQHSRFRVSLSPSTTEIDGDETLLSQALGNLIQNSLRYSDPNRPIAIHTSLRNGRIHITVSDQGEGIAPEDVALLGTPYFRGRNSRGVRGMGLGLYLVSQIAQAHGGQMTLRTTRGEGTAITIELPAPDKSGTNG